MKRILITCCLILIYGTALAQPKADSTNLYRHLAKITQQEGYRNYRDTITLNATADYIKQEFDRWADTTFYQEYQVEGHTYKNVIARFGPPQAATIVIGAHYDVYGNQPGADDNASGVAGLLELARLLAGQPLKSQLQLVAYTLEEPPFFRTEQMGSFVHAKSLKDADVPVLGMVSLEMIGYYSDKANSQQYPVSALRLVYGKQGNYITAVRTSGSGKFARCFTKRFISQKLLPTKGFTGPASMPGLDFSDHMNYLKFGYSALMITDTAFYRNNNYHEATDTLDTLNTAKMALVIDQVFNTVLHLQAKMAAE